MKGSQQKTVPPKKNSPLFSRPLPASSSSSGNALNPCLLRDLFSPLHALQLLVGSREHYGLLDAEDLSTANSRTLEEQQLHQKVRLEVGDHPLHISGSGSIKNIISSIIPSTETKGCLLS